MLTLFILWQMNRCLIECLQFLKDVVRHQVGRFWFDCSRAGSGTCCDGYNGIIDTMIPYNDIGYDIVGQQSKLQYRGGHFCLSTTGGHIGNFNDILS